MAFSIKFRIAGDPNVTLARIMGEARRLGVRIDGDDRQGTFDSDPARGSYSVSDGRIEVTVTDKPFFIPESMIRKVAAEKAPEWGLTVEQDR